MDEHNFNILYETALELAVAAHKGRTDIGGKPYIKHPLHLVAQFIDPTLQIIALLHDVVEDCDISMNTINEKLPAVIADTIDTLTHRKKQSYEDYIEGIKARGDLAVQVKLADLRHNMDITRIQNPTLKDFDRIAKYAAAYKYLID